MKITVNTPARLHLGLLDMNGNLGRLYASIGVAIEHPNVILEAEPAHSLIVAGVDSARIEQFARRFLQEHAIPGGARLTAKSAIPRHVGLGSGTQLALAVGAALAQLAHIQLSTAHIAAVMGRGIHSGIGIAAFDRGGFILDGGHAANGKSSAAANPSPVPPVLFHHPFPADWRFVIAIPAHTEGISGAREHEAFAKFPTAAPEMAEKICRLVLMQMLPALLEQDIDLFGQALTAVQRLVGDSFAAVQGGRYANTLSGQLIRLMLEEGAAGAGQSSWGPTVYGLTKGDEQAHRLMQTLQQRLPTAETVQLFYVRAHNQGARLLHAETL